MPTATSTAFPPSAPPVSSGITTLPSGATFDLIPPALSALERVLASPNFVPSSSSGAGTSSQQQQQQQQQKPAAAAASSQTTSIGASSSSATSSAQQQHRADQQPQQQPSLKDLPELMLAARHKIQAARDTVRALPDIEKSIAQQEAEIRLVERRIERLKRVWEGVRAEAAIRAAEGRNPLKRDEAIIDDDDEADVKMLG